MTTHPTLDELWEDAPRGETPFDPASIAHLPEPARRYLTHAIAPGAPLARAVRLTMEGRIKLGGTWRPFEAEQVIRAGRGMVWRARTQMALLVPIKGYDRVVDGVGEMNWRLFGLIPVVSAEGPDVTRSAIGRMEIESIWLPSMLLADDVRWRADDDAHPTATLQLMGQAMDVDLTVDGEGRLTEVHALRWGDPEQDDRFHLEDFGGQMLQEGTFGGYTVPTQVRVGWHFGTNRFEEEGVFFEATITDAAFR